MFDSSTAKYIAQYQTSEDSSIYGNRSAYILTLEEMGDKGKWDFMRNKEEREVRGLGNDMVRS